MLAKQSAGNRILSSLPGHNQCAKEIIPFAQKDTALILKCKNASKSEFTMQIKATGMLWEILCVGQPEFGESSTQAHNELAL